MKIELKRKLIDKLISLKEREINLSVFWDAGGDECSLMYKYDNQWISNLEARSDLFGNLSIYLINKLDLPTVGHVYKKGIGVFSLRKESIIELTFDNYSYVWLGDEDVNIEGERAKLIRFQHIIESKALYEETVKEIKFSGKIRLKTNDYEEFYFWQKSEIKESENSKNVKRFLLSSVLKILIPKYQYTHTICSFSGRIRKSGIQLTNLSIWKYYDESKVTNWLEKLFE